MNLQIKFKVSKHAVASHYDSSKFEVVVPH